MTVTNTTKESSLYSGNGSTTTFATGFKFDDNSHVKVILRSSAGVETVQTITTHYTVTGAGTQGGGTVTMLVAPASGEKLKIIRNVSFDQQTDYIEGGKFPAASHESALDKLTMLVQQVDAKLNRTPMLPTSSANYSTSTGVVFPDGGSSAINYLIRWDDAGTALEAVSASEVMMSAGAGLTDIVYDTTPQLGGNLDVNGMVITSVTNGNVVIRPDGTGAVVLGGNATQPAPLQFLEDSDNGTNYIAVTAPSSIAANYTITLPAFTGTLYISGGTDVSLDDGGTGASLTDPGADRIMFWDDSAGQVTWLTAGTGLTITGTTIDAAAGSSAASQSDQETATSITTYVTPGRQQFHPSAPKAWARIAYSAGTPAIQASYNVTSLTDHGTGDVSFNYTTSLSVAAGAISMNKYLVAGYVLVTSNGVSALRCTISTTAGAAADDAAMMSVFGDM